jgi:hypothetical protein
MDWWKRLFDADRLIPIILGFVGGATGLFFSFQGTGENAVSIGSVSVNPLQLGLGCACLILSGFLLIRYFYLYRDGNPYKYLP